MDGEEIPLEDYRGYTPPTFDDSEEAAPDAPPGAVESGRFVPAVDPATEDGEQGRRDFAQDHADARTSTPEADFAAIKFQRENTLLTNAESYAASIREEADLYVQQLQREVQALNAEAERRYEEAVATKEAAEQEAERLIADARESAEEIRAQAYAEGFAKGEEEGQQKRYQEAGPSLRQIEAVLLEMKRFRRQVAYYAEKDSVRLAMLMARRILRQELTINKKAVWKLLAATLADLKGQGTFRVWLSPEDHRFAAAARPSLEKYLAEDQAVTFRARPDLKPGNVQIETDRDVIDLTLSSQLHHLDSQLHQSLAERETILLQRGRRPAAEPPAAAPETPALPAADPAPDPADG